MVEAHGFGRAETVRLLAPTTIDPRSQPAWTSIAVVGDMEPRNVFRTRRHQHAAGSRSPAVRSACAAS